MLETSSCTKRKRGNIRSLRNSSDYAKKAINAIIEGLAGKTGLEFFDCVVNILDNWLDVDYALVGCTVDGTTLKALSVKSGGRIVHNYPGSLVDTTMADVAEKGYVACCEGARDLYPYDKELAKQKAEGFVGVSLCDKDNKTIGILCAVSSGKFDLPPQTEDVMRVLAARVVSEILYNNVERQNQQDHDENSLRNIAHDFNNILTAIIGYAFLLKSKFEPGQDTYEFITKIEKAGNRGSELTKLLFSFFQEKQGGCSGSCNCSSGCGSGTT